MAILNSKKIDSNFDDLDEKFDVIRQSAKQRISNKKSNSKSTSNKSTFQYIPVVQVKVNASPASQRQGNYRLWGLAIAAGVIVLGGVGLKLSLNSSEVSPTPPSSSTSLPDSASLTATPVSSNRVVNTIAPIDAFTKGRAIGQQALGLFQSAVSNDDWRLVTHKLEVSINLLSSIPSDSFEYDMAQEQLLELEAQLAIAQSNLNQAIPSDSLLSTATISSGGTSAVGSSNCSSVSTTPESLPVEIHNVEFQGSNADSDAVYIVGCITNHSRQTITSLALIYKATSSEEPGIFRTGNEDIIPVQMQPGQTLHFRSSFTINPAFQTVEIQGITWSAPDSAEPQTASTNVQLTR